MNATGKGAASDSGAGRDDQTDRVMVALLRAVKRAHLEAYLSGTGVIIERAGQIVEIAPDPELYQDLIPPPFKEQHKTADR